MRTLAAALVLTLAACRADPAAAKKALASPDPHRPSFACPRAV